MNLGLIPSILAALGMTAAAAPLHVQIDQQIEAGFAKWSVSPGPICDDAEFVRRIYLDLTGEIPKSRTARLFLVNPDPDKRTKLIEQLLASDAFANRMAVVFDVMLMERRPDKYVTKVEWRKYLAESFAQDKPLDVLAREILVGGSVEDDLRPAAKFYLDRGPDQDALVRDTGRLFLGMDLQCAQCHDHPTIDDWKHQHYYGLRVFFAGSTKFRRPDGKWALQEMLKPTAEFASVFEPDLTKSTGPQIPFGKPLAVPTFEKGEEFVDKDYRKKKQPAVLKFSLRELLAKELTSAANEAFSRNFANRLWGVMMGRGIVHPYAMDHSDNPPSHPELLDLLSRQLRDFGYDTRSFVRQLVLSRTYQRSSSAPEGVDPDSVPPESFALANMKGLSPEQLFRSLLAATGSESVFRVQIERMLQEDEEQYQDLVADSQKMADARKGMREERVTQFVSAFASIAGRPEGDFQASLPQALYLANHAPLIEWLQPESGNLIEWLLARDDPRVVAEEAYLAIFSRLPSEAEVAMVTQHFQARDPERPTAVTELIWALLASSEFRFNH